ncbi:MAG: MarR family winged helix-turn-helix transcriptional regulator [Acidobacteriota bacterium]
MPEREPIGLLVAVVRRRIKQVTTLLVRRHRLSPQQFWTVVAIARGQELSLRELAERRRMDQPTACRVVETLVRRRLITNTPDPADRRRSRLRLTPSGEHMAAEVLPIAATIADVVESSLSAAERRTVVASLRKIVAGLDRFEESTRARPDGGPGVRGES